MSIACVVLEAQGKRAPRGFPRVLFDTYVFADHRGVARRSRRRALRSGRDGVVCSMEEAQNRQALQVRLEVPASRR